DRGDRCSRLVPGRDHAAEAAPLKAVVRDPLSPSRAFHITPAALAFGGVVEKSGVLGRLITPIINAAKSVGALVISVVFVCSRRTSSRPTSTWRLSCRPACSRRQLQSAGSRPWCCHEPPAPLECQRRR